MARSICAGSLALAVGLGACTGNIGGEGQGNQTPKPSAATLNEIGETGLRRLTAAEFDASVRDLVGVVVDSELALPEDLRTPFDNDYTKQQASEALISAADSLAGEIAAEVIADPNLRTAVVPCEPSGPTDEACYRQFVEAFGRQAFRRPLSDEEIEGLSGFMAHAQETSDFWVAVESALRAFFQHPSFLYRVELGIPIEGEEGVFRLTDYELATRLSYLLIGTTPPVWLLDEAAAGNLSDAAGVRAAATKLLEEDRAKDQVARFHAMWLSYEKIPLSSDLADAMQAETMALLERVVFEQKSSWVDMLRATETYLTAELAEHYGLPAPDGGEGWVPYGESGRRGILSQGSFLSAVAKFDDTSPTQRGLLIRTRLFCQQIATPPADLMVNVDEPPEGPDPNACKSERYDMWQTDGCKLCHALMEPVGFGLENYDTAGRFREFEPERPDCPIDGAGTLEGVGNFTGPAELSDLMIEDGGVDECVATQFVRYAIGRYALSDAEYGVIERIVPAAQGVTEETEGGELVFYDLMLELVTGDSFRHRREEAVQ